MLDLKLERSSFLCKKGLLDDTSLSLALLQFQPQIFFAGSGYRDRKQPGFSRPKATNNCRGGVKGKCYTSGFYNKKKNHLSTFTELLKYLETFIFSKKKEKLQLNFSYPLNGCSKLSTYYSPLNFNQSRESHACNMQL